MEDHGVFSGTKRNILIGLFVLIAVYLTVLFTRELFDGQSVSFKGNIFYPWAIAIPQFGLVFFVVCQVGWGGFLSSLKLPKLINFWPLVIIPMVVVLNLGFAAAYASIVLAINVDFLMPPEIPKSILGNKSFIIVNLVVIGIFVPFAEELFFRGFFMISIARHIGLYKSLLLTSILFTCLHGHVGLLIPILFSSITVSMVFIYFRSLWAPITVHSIQNILVSIVAASA